jgi:hypothetical protein
LPGNKPLREQVVVGQQNHCSREPELFRQVSGGWKTLAGAQGTIQDRLAHAAVNLSKKRLSVARDWYRKLHKKWLFEITSEGLTITYGVPKLATRDFTGS